MLIDVLEVAFTPEQDMVLGLESFALYKQMPFLIDGIMCSNFICSEQDMPRIHPVFFYTVIGGGTENSFHPSDPSCYLLRNDNYFKEN